jgi:cytochrome c556
MNLKAVVAAAVLAGVALGSVLAAQGTHDSRIALMKNNGAAAGVLASMAKGEKPFDADAVKAALSTIAETAKTFPAEFGAGSDQNDPEVNPKIWANMDDFKAKANKLASDAQTALANPPANAAAIGPVLKTLGASCGACHEAFRVKKE